MMGPAIVENNLLDTNHSTENDSQPDKKIGNKNLPKSLFEILAQKREQIALLHAKSGAWLSRYERLSQKKDDLVNEIKILSAMEKDLTETAKNFFTEFEKDRIPLNHLINERKKQQKVSFQTTFLPLQNSQSPKKALETTRLTKTLTECYREIIEQSGLPWLFVDQILVSLKKDYNIVRTKSNVASVLRQGAKKNRNFKFYGRNRFGLIENSSQKKN